jgi:hypothetical protein
VGRRSTSEAALAGSFTFGAVAGALGTAALILLARGLVTPIPQSLVSAVGATIAGGIAIAALVRGDCPLLQTRRQIPSDLLVGRTPRGAFEFALQLGTGLVTYLPSCAPHVLVLLLVTLPVSVLGLVASAVGFGVGRSAGFVSRAAVTARDNFETRFQHGVALLVRTAPAAVAAILLVAQLG